MIGWIVAIVLLALAAGGVWYVRRAHRANESGEPVGAPASSADVPVEPAVPPVITPAAPSEPEFGGVPDCVADVMRVDSLVLVRFRELLDITGPVGDVLREAWWVAQVPLICGLVDPADKLAVWSIAGNLGCQPDGTILWGHGFPSEGFESGGWGSKLAPISNLPPSRYEHRKDAPLNRANDRAQVRRVATRSLHGHEALPADKCYYNEASTRLKIFRARIHGDGPRQRGQDTIWAPIPVAQHGEWLRNWILGNDWDPRRLPGTGDGGGEFSP